MPDASVVLVDGPWRHRDVTANGARFHVAECGPADGPLVLLLHGFPQFWWTWRAQLEALGEAGFRAVAPDLRGYGASDKPPRGYDQYTLAADVAGLVRALGARDCLLVGHDWGGTLAWGVAALHPKVVRSLVTVSTPHLLGMRAALLSDGVQRRASRYQAFFQLPKAPEARLVRDDGAYVAGLLRAWGGPGFPGGEAEHRYREAIQIPAAANCTLEWYRWAFRSQTRPSGRRYLRRLAEGVDVPVLDLTGSVDGCILPATVARSQQWARAGHELRVLDGIGHFPQEEVPDVVSAALLEVARR